MPRSSPIFLLLFLLSCEPHPLAAAADSVSSRRVLHQPLFPADSPVPSPPATPAPEFPFSSPASGNTPFFPSPPSPSAIASLPTNTTPLSIPRVSQSKPSSYLKLIAIAAAVVAVIVFSVAGFLHFRRKWRSLYPPSDSKPYDSSNRLSIGNNTAAGAGANLPAVPKLGRPSQRSSEFLYLGTMVNSQGGIESQVRHNLPRRTVPRATTSRRMDSPELLPLQRLHEQGFRQKYMNADEEVEEFYSPRESSGGRENLIRTGSASRGDFTAIEVGNCGGSNSSSSSSSCSSSSSSSGSPRRSVSLSISPPPSLSPKSSIPKSPELVPVQIVHPSQATPFPMQLADARDSQSPSPASSCSPERDSIRSIESSPRMFSIRDQNIESQQRINSRNPQSPAETSSPSLNSPVRMGNSMMKSPARTSSPPQQGVSVSAPPPPPPAPPRLPVPSISILSRPPPPPPLRAKHLENPIPMPEPQVMATPLMPTTTENPGSNNKQTEEVFSCESVQKNEAIPKPKLKPLHWDKVRASSDHEMVWDHLKSSSFKVNEEMIETLFVVNAPNSKANETAQRPILPSPSQELRVLDPKRSQNIAISLRALNVTIEEVCEALLEGNADSLGTEVLESLLKMAPSKEEERKLRECRDDSPFKLGAAEKFLKAVLSIPFAFKRVDAMLFASNFDSEVDYLKKSFKTLEAACEELRSSRMFLKLLEAVLKTGNRMNVGTARGEAHAFKLDTLLKLVHVKATDGTTTLLHFVVKEIIRTEGARLSSSSSSANKYQTSLQVVSSITSDLTNVKKAAAIDSEILHSDVQKLSRGIGKIAEVVRLSHEEDKGLNCRMFSESMKRFMEVAEEEIIRLQALQSVALSLVKEITEYFHGDSAKEEAHPFRIFMVVRDFLITLDRVCKEVGMMNEQTTPILNSAHKFPVPVNPILQPDTSGQVS